MCAEQAARVRAITSDGSNLNVADGLGELFQGFGEGLGEVTPTSDLLRSSAPLEVPLVSVGGRWRACCVLRSTFPAPDDPLMIPVDPLMTLNDL